MSEQEKELTEQTTAESTSSANTEEEFSAIKNYSYTPKDTEPHDYQDEKMCSGAVVQGVLGMGLSILSIIMAIALNRFGLITCIYPAFPLIGLFTSLKVMKKDKTLKAAKYSLVVCIVSLVVTIGIAIFAIFALNKLTELIH